MRTSTQTEIGRARMTYLTLQGACSYTGAEEERRSVGSTSVAYKCLF